MYRPTIQSNLWLGLIALIFIGLYYWSDNSRVAVRPTDYSARKQAAETMMEALETLQNYRIPAASRNISDSMLVFHTMLGDKDSPITTDEGRLEDKITVLNPNIAAAMVDMFDIAEVSRGDTAAVLLTGSMPGANIALFSAAKALGIHLVVVTSVGSSWWGANSPDFTWLDMERVLEQSNI
ncbi:MAG: poly-gamma-glutamate system protein, partial [Candidatus Electryoneaceae bacterium]|nr:poly-gamma-glutamate system protein [Candidatus Electryoneaceae bacterium]